MQKTVIFFCLSEEVNDTQPLFLLHNYSLYDNLI